MTNKQFIKDYGLDTLKMLIHFGLHTFAGLKETFEYLNEYTPEQTEKFFKDLCQFITDNCTGANAEEILQSHITKLRNNGKTELEINFNIKRGDLIYGLSSTIDDFLDKLEKTSPPKDLFLYASKINWYNHAIQVGVNAAASVDKNMQKREIEKWIEHYKTALSGQYDQVSPSQQQRYKSFLLKIYQSEKYSPLKAIDFHYNHAKILRETEISIEEKRVKYAVRLACKFGIHFISSIGSSESPANSKSTKSNIGSSNSPDNSKPIESRGKIHYLLDGIDMKKVVEQPANEVTVPIITTELKHIYRHWDTLEHSVIFYLEETKCLAPWISDSDLWDKYVVQRQEKRKKINSCSPSPDLFDYTDNGSPSNSSDSVSPASTRLGGGGADSPQSMVEDTDTRLGGGGAGSPQTIVEDTDTYSDTEYTLSYCRSIHNLPQPIAPSPPRDPRIRRVEALRGTVTRNLFPSEDDVSSESDSSLQPPFGLGWRLPRR